MKDYRPAVQLYEAERHEAFGEPFEVQEEDVFKLRVAYVAGRNQEQFIRLLAQEKRVNEVGIFSDDDEPLAGREVVDEAVGRPVAERQVQRVYSPVPRPSQQSRTSRRGRCASTRNFMPRSARSF